MKKIMLSLIACIMVLLMGFGTVLPAFSEGTAPLAENLELSTYRGVSVGGRLSAYDPEGDVVSFEICTGPVKGSIKLESDGNFIYTPDEGKKGRDYFGYKATDSQGNISQEATVIIRIEKQKQGVSYSDMENMPGEYAAVYLSEKGIFTGSKIGEQYCFEPDTHVSRGEFLSMCMLISGREALSGVLSTGYADDGEIPQWIKGYIMTASMEGLACVPAQTGNVFDAQAAISRTEAMQLLNDTLGLYDVEPHSLSADDAYVLQACINLGAVGIIDDISETQALITRQEAAIMLAKAIDLIENR